jgi:hypothetical protein
MDTCRNSKHSQRQNSAFIYIYIIYIYIYMMSYTTNIILIGDHKREVEIKEA